MKKSKLLDRLYVFICFLFFLLLGYYIFGNYSKGYTKINEDFNISIYQKGMKGAVDFLMYNGETYIAFKDRIVFINGDGFSEVLIEDDTFDIHSMQLHNEKIYFSESNNLHFIDINTKKNNLIVKDLENKGDYDNIEMLVKDDKLYLSIPSMTNSGVIGNDNVWADDDKDLVKLASLYGDESRNGIILEIDLNTYEYSIFSTGLRNVTGMSLNSEEQLIASVLGFEDRGARPIKGDSDYIYIINHGIWYGYPDYSGGDPLSSDRFSGENGNVIPILENQINTNPPAPIYQHDNVSSIHEMVVDEKGIFYNKDGVFFYDVIRDSIMHFNNKGFAKEILKFNDGDIKSLRIYGDSLYFLHSKNGYIYKLNM